MLFSNDQVAGMINQEFEPVWVSLREVPRVTIDFGNGNVVRRTLHGNIATWICSNEGTVIDILPGVYSAPEYMASLQSLVEVHRAYTRLDSPDERQTLLAGYHRDSQIAARGQVNTISNARAMKLDRSLEHDSSFNQGVRRRAIHQHLEGLGLVTPESVTHWLYREVLNADLDDVYLGLGSVLFDNYPFTTEESE